ncbi:MAG TPA: phosphatase PAP2 family protein, partial [Blastocatellia bacterium]|nr:phosphatase PAP2 family protein [Blastocatellia bacterium]
MSDFTQIRNRCATVLTLLALAAGHSAAQTVSHANTASSQQTQSQQTTAQEGPSQQAASRQPGTPTTASFNPSIPSIYPGRADANGTQQLLAQVDPAQSNPAPSPTSKGPSLEHDFLKNVLRDQRAIWTAPLHLHGRDAYWLVPLAGGTAALFATDRSTAEDGGEFAANSTHQKVSDSISSVGTIYVGAGLVGSLYVVGRLTDNSRARETAVLAAEAALDTAILGQALKFATGRARPSADSGRGDFLDRGSSFPSGHSLAAWSVATVIANEYRHRRWVAVSVYTLAAMVSASRFTGHHHFLSDILVGSAMGYGVGRYVYHAHHDPAMNRDTAAARGIGRHISEWASRLSMTPLYNPTIREC